jgi:hypothetical protein
VAPGAAGPLAEILNHALRMSATERAEFGAAARAGVIAQFTAAAMQQATLAVYRELLG